MIFFWVPETKQRTLEELDYIFAVPTKLFVSYQVRKAVPYFIQRYIFWRKNAVLEPLYQIDMAGAGSDSEGVGGEGEKAGAESVERKVGPT